MYLYNYKRLIKGKVTLGKGIQCKKVIKIIEENIYNSTLDIWCKKEMQHPKLIQYEVYKCFVLKFELADSGFFHPEIDIFQYTLKCVAYAENIDEFPIYFSDDEESLELADQFFDNCKIIGKDVCSEFIKNVYYENEKWYI